MKNDTICNIAICVIITIFLIVVLLAVTTAEVNTGMKIVAAVTLFMVIGSAGDALMQEEIESTLSRGSEIEKVMAPTLSTGSIAPSTVKKKRGKINQKRS